MNPLHAVLTLTGTVAILVVLSFLINRFRAFSQLQNSRNTVTAGLSAGILGGLFGIYANINGVLFNEAVISIRDLGPMMAGFAGGPLGGLIAGLIAAAHRLTMGGATVYACSLATVTIGIMTGFLSITIFRKTKMTIGKAFWIALFMEIWHLLLVLMMVKPLEYAREIIFNVAFPLLLANSVGFALLIATVTYINRERAEQKKKNSLENELSIATNIQHSMLPDVKSVNETREDVGVAGSMHAAKEVGGDFFDVFYVDDTHLAMVMAEVSGKGIPAGLFMIRACTILRNTLSSGLPPAEAVAFANKELCTHNAEEMFVTAFVGIVDLKSDKLHFANAGHNPPVIRHEGQFSYLKMKNGFVMGGMDGIPYKPQETDFGPGDAIFLYTDGVTEAENSEHDLFGEERLQKTLQNHRLAGPEDMIRTVAEDIELHADGAEQFDDITMLYVVRDEAETENDRK